MKILRTASIGLLLASSLTIQAQTWGTDYAKAVSLSKKTGKPILVNFTGSDWCGWCKRLDDEVFSKAEFRSWAKSNVILLVLDYPARKKQSQTLKAQNEKLATKFGVQSYPTILMVNSGGKVLGSGGYMEGGPKAFTKLFGSFIPKKAKK
jgi:protein disulfide-isomerase